MKLIVTGFPASIHFLKITKLLGTLGWDVHIAGSTDTIWHEGFSEVTGVTIHHSSRVADPPANPLAEVVDHRGALDGGTYNIRGRARYLATLISDIGPDVVHSHEIQHGGYAAVLAREYRGGDFPTWLQSNWGADIYFYARPPEHRAMVRLVLANVDVLWAECWRDLKLARAEGFHGLNLPAVPIAGGYDRELWRSSWLPGPASARTAISVKGYQHEVGRARHALAALTACSDLMIDREVILHSINLDSVVDEFQRACDAMGARLTVLRMAPYSEVQAACGRARVSLALSIADGVSTSFLEALVGGSFPIQSRTACSSEWVIDGESGLLVDPLDVTGVARALRRALTDDELIDRAGRLNEETVRTRLDWDVIRGQLVAGYQRAHEYGLQRHGSRVAG